MSRLNDFGPIKPPSVAVNRWKTLYKAHKAKLKYLRSELVFLEYMQDVIEGLQDPHQPHHNINKRLADLMEEHTQTKYEIGKQEELIEEMKLCKKGIGKIVN